jgi:peptidoglycan/LPS O-acetylase OafA/YrhL
MRAFAALSVMLAHIVSPELPEITRYVFTGLPAVFVFFVISGFCIHYPYINKPLPVGAFLAARATRIMLPVIIAMILANAAHVLYFTLRDGYILWSITCELWYYGLYPVFYALSRFLPWRIQWAVAFVVCTGLAISWGTDQWGNFHYRLGPWRNWVVGLPSWLLGCVLAEELARQKSESSSHIYIWRLSVSATASALFWMSLNTPVKFNLTLNFFSILVLYWMRAEIASATSTTWLDWIGTWSFSIYILHIIAQALLLPFTNNGLLIVLPVLAICYAGYLLFEFPSHAVARKIFSKLSTFPLFIPRSGS